MSTGAALLSVNVGKPRTVEYGGKKVRSAIWKEPVDRRVAARGVNLEGDGQANRRVHGGVDKAIYAYSREDYEWWETELGRSFEPGTFGDNLTTRGIDPSAALIGERWRIGSALLEVSEPRFPCYKLGMRMDDPGFLKRFAEARRTGTYLRIVSEGELGSGDEIEVRDRPAHGVTIGLFTDAYLGDRDLLPDVLAAEQLSDDWRIWITKRIAA
jgi:MOSC domain-containing protein YiiM